MARLLNWAVLNPTAAENWVMLLVLLALMI